MLTEIILQTRADNTELSTYFFSGLPNFHVHVHSCCFGVWPYGPAWRHFILRSFNILQQVLPPIKQLSWLTSSHLRPNFIWISEKCRHLYTMWHWNSERAPLAVDSMLRSRYTLVCYSRGKSYDKFLVEFVAAAQCLSTQSCNEILKGINCWAQNWHVVDMNYDWVWEQAYLLYFSLSFYKLYIDQHK